jgi:ubiquinone/menaquinone biosynthesis C-methylase UbiE
VVDAVFTEPRLAAIYDALDGDRLDLAAYVAMVDEFGVRSVLDIGGGTGSFACLLASHSIEVTAVDPAAASLHVARHKAHADRVRWILGDATSLPPLAVDLATMTGNVAQVFVNDEEWTATLSAVWRAVAPAGRLVFETRDPDRKGWEEWTRERSYRLVTVPGVDVVETWVDLTDVSLPLVSFRSTFVFQSDGAVLTSESTLRFRSHAEIDDSLRAAGFVIDDVRGAPDRPGRELVFVAAARGAQT